MKPLKQAQHFDALPTPDMPVLKASNHFEQPVFVVPEEAPVQPLVQPTRWWWRLAGITFLAIVLLSVWQWGQALAQSWQQSVLAGTALTAISLAVAVLLGAVLWRELRLWRRLARNRKWQHSAERIRNSVQFGEAGALCQAIAESLPSNPHIMQALETWRSAVRDEHSDEEQLQLFEKLVLVELDKQAQAIIYRGATDTSLAVAISPFALADMLLLLWRSSRMVRELAQLYGGAIGQLRSLVLLKRFMAALLWAGGSELALDMASDVIGSEFTAKLSARAGQGLIAGVLVARLGNLAQQQLRPLPTSDAARVSIKALAGHLVQRFTKKTAPTKADS